MELNEIRRLERLKRFERLERLFSEEGRVPPWHGAGQLLRGVMLVQTGVKPERIASAVEEELGWVGTGTITRVDCP